MSGNRCWHCQKPTGFVYSLQWGKHGDWQQQGYYCGKDCLVIWINEHWEEL